MLVYIEIFLYIYLAGSKKVFTVYFGKAEIVYKYSQIVI